MSFLFQYIANPRNVGAIIPSSRFLGNKMTEEIDFERAKYIVEYGPGTGVFTEILIKKRNPRTMIIAIENNKEFYLLLKQKFKEENNFILIYGSAENADRLLKSHHIPYADYVVSGLPFASLPKQVSSNILISTTSLLKRDGKFITLQYTKLKYVFFEQFFTNIEIQREYRNLPPAYVLSCSMPKEHGEDDYA